jgi:hypothetical protein
MSRAAGRNPCRGPIRPSKDEVIGSFENQKSVASFGLAAVFNVVFLSFVAWTLGRNLADQAAS